MISKHYSVFCDKCTKTEQLFSGNIKDCEKEAKRMGWEKVKGEWMCKDCVEEIKNGGE